MSIKTLASQIMKIKPENIKDDEDLVEKHGMDSMLRVELMIELEKEYDIEIPDDKSIELRTVSKIAEFVKHANCQK